MEERKDAWNDCVSWDDRPKSLCEGLNILADWFDAVYQDNGGGTRRFEKMGR